MWSRKAPWCAARHTDIVLLVFSLSMQAPSCKLSSPRAGGLSWHWAQGLNGEQAPKCLPNAAQLFQWPDG